LAPRSEQPGWQALIELARVEHLTVATYQLAMSTALEGLATLSQAGEDAAVLAAFYDQVEQNLLQPLASKLPMGKSTVPVLRGAHALGIPFVHLGAGVFQLGWGHRARRVDRSTTAQDSAMGNRLSHNKSVCAALLKAAGLPAPQHLLVQQASAAWASAQAMGLPVVVKPVDLERGEGVSVDLYDEASVTRAFELAHSCSPSHQVLVERQVQGTCHRLLVAQGRLLYAVRRGPMAVQGDGQQTVAELVAAEVARQQRRPPWSRSAIAPLDDLALAELARNGLHADSVPAAGNWVSLRRIETTAWGGVDEELTEVVHPANRALALHCAELFGLSVAGVDVITPDIAQPWWTNGAIVNEVNFAPLMGGHGRIPTAVFVGGPDARLAALAQHHAWVQAGLACHFTSSHETLDDRGQDLPLSVNSAFDRVRALLLSPQVQALVVWTDSDEFARKGSPLEFIEQLQVVDRQLVAYTPDPAQTPAAETLADKRVDRVLAVLQERLPRGKPSGPSPR
jgi:D-alanine-D-alanine ligase-like ATP-grasp enzyme